VVAIERTLYCHEKILVARGDLSIATITIVVAISGTLFCYDKCLVAKGGLSIATINTWFLYLDPLLPHNCVAIVWRLYCHGHSFIGMSFLPHHLFVAIVYIATPNDYADSPYCNALFGSFKQ
jgi:hypothetical protein